MATGKPAKNETFEHKLDNLETLVEAMEQGDLTLEEAMKQFEQGIKLTRECQQALQQAEQKVSILMAEQEEQELQAYLIDDNEDEAFE